MKQSRLLDSLGFDAKTEKVYRSLLALADAPVSAIAKKAGLKRTSVYYVLENLMEYGLASSYTSRGTKRYFAENPNKLKSFFEEKMILASRLIPILQKETAGGRGKVKIRYFEGASGLKSISESALDIKEKLMLSIGSTQKYLKYTGGRHGFGARRRKKGIMMRSLRFPSDHSSSSPERLQKFRVLPEEFEFPGYILIFGNKVGITIFEDRGFGFLVESREFHEIFETFHPTW